MTDWWGIVWLVVLLLGNAFFVGAEFAVISAKRSQIEPLAERFLVTGACCASRLHSAGRRYCRSSERVASRKR